MKKILYLPLFILFFACAKNNYPQYSKLSKPELNFEVFWNTFNDNYAFFDLYGVNWDSTYINYRSRVNSKTSNTELIAIFNQMLSGLKDSHITIEYKGEFVFKGEGERNTFKTEFKGLKKNFQNITDSVLLKAGFAEIVNLGQLIKNEPFLRYTSSNGIGYLCINRFYNNLSGITGSDNDQVKDKNEMLRLLDTALVHLNNCQSIIIDLRTNGGGHSGTDFAARFTGDTLLTHYISTINKKVPGEPVAQYLIPTGTIRFTKKLILLTSDRTASSAEDFVLSLVARENVTVVGTATSGTLSDMYNFQLPNKMNVTLSNQRYLSRTDKQLLESKGIPANETIMYSKTFLTEKKDPQLSKALELLR